MILKFLILSLIFLSSKEVKGEESKGCLNDYIDGLVTIEGFRLCMKEEKIKEEKRLEFFKEKGFIDKPFRNLKTHPEASMDPPKKINIPWGMPKGSIPSGEYTKLPWSYFLFRYNSPYENPEKSYRADLYFGHLNKTNEIRSIYFLKRKLFRNVGKYDLNKKLAGFYQPKFDAAYNEFNCKEYTSRFKTAGSFSIVDSKDDTGFVEDGFAEILKPHPDQKKVKIDGRYYFVLGSNRKMRDWDYTNEFTWGRFMLDKVCQM